ncbi:MAG: exodeoxyribonuclease V subunit gamma [Desulfobacterales bacterium]
MTSLILHTSNRLERLLETLAETVIEPLSDPFDPEIVLVQSRGMERWVTMGLAARLGICVNLSCPFPKVFVDGLVRGLVADTPEHSPFERGALSFRILNLLSMPEDVPPSLTAYLQLDPGGLKRYQLAVRIADCFDQYQVYRPDMILRWSGGPAGDDPDEDWQRELWRRVVEGAGAPHRTGLCRLLVDRLRSREEFPIRLPERLSVFGISYLPPFYFDILAAIADRIPVHLFLLSPTREFWGDIVSEKEKRRIRSASRSQGGDLHLDAGNPIVGSLGGLGKSFFSLAVSKDADIIGRFDAPGRSCLLHAVQQDILDLSPPPGASRPDPAGSLPEGVPRPVDGSIQVHFCHSPFRETEVLYDQLVALFEEHPDLAPSDVMVMTPDIERYTPFVRAVFDSETDPARRIPYSIADRGFRDESRLAEEFTGLLNLRNARMTVTEVMGVLESEGIRRRFELESPDLERISNWIQAARIRWGADRDAKVRLGLPDADEHTWAFGIDRLLLGYAMFAEEEDFEFADRVPAGGAEGGDAAVLGRFLRFLESLFEFARSLSGSRTLKEWTELLSRAVETFWKFPEPEATVTQRLRDFLNELAASQAASDCGIPVTLDVVKAFLDERMDAERHPGGFISGGVTFCAMVPMRSIPAEVICLIGLDGDRFPREDRSPGFDLMAKRPRPEDRTRRNDDRYLFLESLLSARRCFYISCVGQSVRDNAVLPPSVLVSELLDHLAEGYGVSRDDLVVRHRLQGWSSAYFDGGAPRLFSYSRSRLEAARRLGEARRSPRPVPPFWETPLSVPEPELKAVDLDTISRFFSNPSRFFLQWRIGVHLPGDQEEEDREPFDLGGLERFHLGNELVALDAETTDPEEIYRRSRGQGVLPHGQQGRIAFYDLWTEARQMAERAGLLAGADAGDPVEVNLRLGDFTVAGTLTGCRREGLAIFRYGRMNAAVLLSAWLRHLALCTTRPDIASSGTCVIARFESFRMTPVPAPAECLHAMLDLYWRGLREPIPLYPEASLEYARRILTRSEPPETALARAASVFSGNDFQAGDRDDPYVALCLRGREAIDARFAETAIEVFQPLLAHLERIP